MDAVSQHYCTICLELGGLRYCAPCVSTYLCLECRHNIAQDWGNNPSGGPDAAQNACPNCRRRISSDPLDCAEVDALPPGLVERPFPTIKMLAYSDAAAGIDLGWFTGVRVGVGNPNVSEGLFRNTVAYFVAVSGPGPGQPLRMLVFFIGTTLDGHDVKVLYDKDDWNPNVPTAIIFDDIFKDLSRERRKLRAYRYIQRAQRPPRPSF